MIAEFFVKGKCLKGEGIKPDADAAMLDCDLLGFLHESPAQTCSSQFCGNRQIFNEEPVVSGATPKTADGLLIRAFEKQGHFQEVGRGTVLLVVL